MTNPGENDPSNPTERQRLLADALLHLRTATGWAEGAIPEGGVLSSMQTELYQSKSLRVARAISPGSYMETDRSLIILDFQDGKQTFLVMGRVDPPDPYDFEHAIGGGIDPRDTAHIIYSYDGGGAITEYLPEGSRIFTGDAGNPIILLKWLRSQLGYLMTAETI